MFYEFFDYCGRLKVGRLKVDRLLWDKWPLEHRLRVIDQGTCHVEDNLAKIDLITSFVVGLLKANTI